MLPAEVVAVEGLLTWFDEAVWDRGNSPMPSLLDWLPSEE